MARKSGRAALTLNDEQRSMLEELSGSRTAPVREVERAIGRRARRFMPFVILVLFGAGIGMAWPYRETLAHPFDTSFATLLWLKILLAASVLAHFIAAMVLGGTGRL